MMNRQDRALRALRELGDVSGDAVDLDRVEHRLRSRLATRRPRRRRSRLAAAVLVAALCGAGLATAAVVKWIGWTVDVVETDGSDLVTFQDESGSGFMISVPPGEGSEVVESLQDDAHLMTLDEESEEAARLLEQVQGQAPELSLSVRKPDGSTESVRVPRQELQKIEGLSFEDLKRGDPAALAELRRKLKELRSQDGADR